MPKADNKCCKRVYASTVRSAEYARMSNEQIANLLLHKVWDALELFSPEADLVMEAIERLQALYVQGVLGCLN